MFRLVRWSALALIAAAALAAVGADAQPVLAPPPATTATTGRPAGSDPVGLPTVTRARFKIEGVSIKAIDETGWDFLGEDEVVGVFRSDGHEVHTGIYDMDHGETDTLRDGQSCISPSIDTDGKSNHRWSCDEDGRPGGADFLVALYEYDGPIDNLFGFCVGGAGIDDIQGADCYDKYNASQIGRRHVVLSEVELLSRLPHVGDVIYGSVPINQCSAYEQPGVVNTCTYDPHTGEYVFNFKITRTADLVAPSLDPPATPR